MTIKYLHIYVIGFNWDNIWETYSLQIISDNEILLFSEFKKELSKQKWSKTWWYNIISHEIFFNQ